MPSLLTTASTLMCPHGGTVTASPGATKAKADAMLVRKGDTFSIAGCPFMIGSVAHPCTTVNWVVASTRVKHDGDFVLTSASTGLCLAADQAPQGTVIVASTQPRVSGQ
ncbi:MAG: hypothetical protein JF570_11225 [Caulobacter sp.]|nr:hypothetical protein [Caulobacter sp.]MBW8891339.1 hypothetical protein [Burkholderiales bacterium]